MEAEKRGGFTLPGEAGYEKLTLQLAEKWGADVIRDSDGTQLSEDILNTGYGIYSTICIIRDHNAWAREHRDCLQQTVLMSEPVPARSEQICIDLLKGYFREQFEVNESPDSQKYWQVYDRTAGTMVAKENWSYDGSGKVTVKNAQLWHEYTVNFFAWRVWEEISMYNHVTNHWKQEHLMQLDPRYPEVQEYLIRWLKQWCEEHPATTVVRFTSLFYNFVWIWGEDSRNRNLFTDWGSYDFTVSPRALEEFEQEYGYALTLEDFINQGDRHVTHMPPDDKKRDWMRFIHHFVTGFAKKLVDLVHQYKKEAYLFYDDSWVGAEPYGPEFASMGFDGMIKCVFSAYEVRMCADVPTKVHEIRLHPYLFPVGLGGKPTFMEGGDPAADAKRYWHQVRRALLRCKIDRIGLGGYLHLTESFPDFTDYIEQVAREHRILRALHEEGRPQTLPVKVGVLHSWGNLRPWTLSGHFHESDSHPLIHVNESLAGMPLDVKFLSFEEVLNGAADEYQVIINGGDMGTAWSGGEVWKNIRLVEILTQWTEQGGIFIGVRHPGAVEGAFHTFAMSQVLGVDLAGAKRANHGLWEMATKEDARVFEGCNWKTAEGVYVCSPEVDVLMQKEGKPLLTEHAFGKGKGIYLSDFQTNPQNTRLLLRLICQNVEEQSLVPDNLWTECSYFPESNKLVWINNSEIQQRAVVKGSGRDFAETLMPGELKVQEVGNLA